MAKKKPMKAKSKKAAQTKKEQPEEQAKAAKTEEQAKAAKGAKTKKDMQTEKRPAADQESSKGVLRKPAGAAKDPSWNEWAAESEGEDGEKGEKGEKDAVRDTRAPENAQRYVFDKALKQPPGSIGGLPQELFDYWQTIQGKVKEKHAFRNAIVPRDANYGNSVAVGVAQMEMVRTVFLEKKKDTTTVWSDME